MSAQTEPYVYETTDPAVGEPALPANSIDTSDDSGESGLSSTSLLPASPYLAPTVNERIEPSRSNRWSAFDSVAASATQVNAIRSAYGDLQAPFSFQLGAGVDVSYDDNVFLTETNQDSDVIIRPQVRLAAMWNITELNTLTLEVVAGYAKYMSNSELDDFFIESSIAPASRADLQIFIGDFVISVYDEYSYSASPFQIVDETGEQADNGDYGRFTNSLGADVLWDLNDLVFALGISHYNFWAIGSDVEQLERGTDQASGSAKINVGPSLQAGVEVSASLTKYEEDFQNDGDGGNLGGFIEWALTDATRLRAAAGWQSLDFDTGGGNGDEEDSSDYYANVLISNRITQFISHTLDLGHEATLGLNTNFVSSDYIRYTADFDVIRNVTLSLQIGYNQNDESAGEFEDDHDLLYASVNARYQIGSRLSMSGGYSFNERSSEREGFGYNQNLFTLSLNYNY